MVLLDAIGGDPAEKFQYAVYNFLNRHLTPEQYQVLLINAKRLKTFLASCACMLLVLMVFVGVSLNYCVLQIEPIANFILLFAALTLLAYCEALHYGVVSIEKWDMEQYKEKFPRAYNCWKLVDTPSKVKKFLVGRQFFTIFVVFLISQITSFPFIPPNFIGMPHGVVLALIETGLPGVAIVLTFGQLVSQIFVEEFTLQFMNLYGCNFVIRISLAAEYIGICHFSWLLFHSAARVFCSDVKKAKKVMRLNSQTELSSLAAGNSTTTIDVEESPTEKNRGPGFDTGLHTKEALGVFDYLKYLWSTFATGCSVGIILYGISIRAYVLPTPPAAAYIIAVLMLANLFFLEGLMIAIVATQYWDPETWKDVYPVAYATHKLVNLPDNVKRFIIGRQFFTVLTNFLLGQIFTFAFFENPGWNPILFYIVIKSGLVGVLTTLSFGQLMPELLAAEYPLRFMNLTYSYWVVYMSLFFDFIGVGHCAWAFYYLTRSIFCRGQIGEHEKDIGAAEGTKSTMVAFESPEVFAQSDKFKNDPTGKSYQGVNTNTI